MYLTCTLNLIGVVTLFCVWVEVQVVWTNFDECLPFIALYEWITMLWMRIKAIFFVDTLTYEKGKRGRTINITGLQRNWGKHKIPIFTEFEGAEFKFEIRFYSSPLVF